MDFWLEDNDADQSQDYDDPMGQLSQISSGQHQSQSQSQQTDLIPGTQTSTVTAASAAIGRGPSQPATSSQSNTAIVACDNCGSTDFYFDATTGSQVCTVCFTQSQQPELDGNDNEGIDFDTIFQVAAKTKSGHIVTRKSTGGGAINNNKQRPLSSYDQSTELPSLLSCLQGLQYVLQQSLFLITTKLLEWSREERDQAQLVARHLWVSYLNAWREAADYYSPLYPHVRFCLRDACLLPKYQSIVTALILHKAVCEEMKQEQQSQSDSQEQGNENEPMVVSSAHSRGPNNDESASPMPASKRPRLRLGHKTSQVQVWRHMVAQHRLHTAEEDPKRIGRCQAALLLPSPGMELIATILYVSLIRRGITAPQFLDWICSTQAVPLQNAYRQVLTPRQQKELAAARVAFCLPVNIKSNMTAEWLQSNTSLLLVAAKLKHAPDIRTSSISLKRSKKRNNDSSFTPGDDLPPKLAKHSIRTLSATSIPVVLAQLGAQLGLSQIVYDTALALMGKIQPSSSSASSPFEMKKLLRRARMSGLPRPLKRATTTNVHSINQLAVIAFCAIILQPRWRQELVVLRQQQPQHSVVPIGDEALQQLMLDGKEVDHYIKFCQDTLPSDPRNSTKSTIAELLGGNPPIGLELDSATAAHTVRPCPIIAGSHPLGVEDAAMPPSLLQRHLYHECVKQELPRHQRRLRAQITPADAGPLPMLDPYETLLIEILARTIHSSKQKLKQALADLLGYKP